MTRVWRNELPVEALRAAFEYREGLLVRKTRQGPFPAGSVAGCPNGRGYVVVGFMMRQYLAHRIVWALHHVTVPEHLDHVNGDGMDNRIENLRECSQTHNNQNARPRRKRSSRFKGVTQFTKGGWTRWRARIVVDKKEISLGYFETETDAAEAYRKAAHAHFGAFARTDG